MSKQFATRREASRHRRLMKYVKRGVSALAALALTTGGVLSMATTASATTDMPSQDVSCEAITADYHRPLTNGDHINVNIEQTDHSVKQVNMYVDQNIAGGASYDGQNNLGLRWKILGVEQTPIPLSLDQVKAGIINFSYGAALKQQGVNSWTLTWVQTNNNDTNYTLECGETTPTCVQSPTWSYTFDGVGSGTVVVSATGAAQGDKLCDALAVRAATYEYDRPASGNPSWPQTKIGYNDVLVDTIGTFSYAAPALDMCRQHDIYAEFVSNGGFDALAVPDKLLGPNNPYEPKFLHQTLSGKGPNPTYSTTTTEGCNVPPTPKDATASVSVNTTATCTAASTVTFSIENATWDTEADLSVGAHTRGATADSNHLFSDGNPTTTVSYTIEGPKPAQSTDPSADCYVPPTPEPEEVTGSLTFQTYSCTEGSKNWATGDGVPGGFFVITDENGKSFETKIGEGYNGNVPEGLAFGALTVKLVDGDSDDLYIVTPWSGTWTTIDPTSLDCRPIKQEATASVNIETAATCDANGTVAAMLSHATLDGKLSTEPGTHTITATAEESNTVIYRFPGSEAHPDGLKSVEITYTVPAATGYQSEDPTAPCYTTPELPPAQATGSAYTEVLSCKTGTRNFVSVDAIHDAIWTFTDKDGNVFVTKVGEGYAGNLPDGLNYGLISIVISDGGTDETMEIVANDSYWTPVNPTSLHCETEPTPTPTPTPTETPSATPIPTPSSTEPPVTTSLPNTGGVVPVVALTIGSLLLAAGGLLSVLAIRRRQLGK